MTPAKPASSRKLQPPAQSTNVLDQIFLMIGNCCPHPQPAARQTAPRTVRRAVFRHWLILPHSTRAAKTPSSAVQPCVIGLRIQPTFHLSKSPNTCSSSQKLNVLPRR